MDTDATPLPWAVDDRRRAALKNIRIVAGDHDVCWLQDVHQRDHLGGFKGDHEAADAVDAVGLANANLIVLAVNTHADLVAALETAVRWLKRLEQEHPGCLNDDAIDKHLMPALEKVKSA